MAERSLNLIIEDINTSIVNTVSFGSSTTTRGLCYLQEKDEKIFPLENTGRGQGNKISFDDKYPLQIYHRILEVNNDNDPGKGFGKYPYRQRIYSMRLVGIGTRSKLTNSTYEDNQEFATAVSDAIPEFISSQEYAQVVDNQVIKQEVYDSEFSGVTELKKLSLDSIAFWVDYTLSVTVCLRPSAPTNLQASAVNQNVTLTWR